MPQEHQLNRKKSMAQSGKLLLLLPALVLLLLVQAQGARPAAASKAKPTTKCAASSVTVSQSNTGDKAGYDPVFEVTVRNTCRCAVRGVYLRSEGFASSVAVDPRLFRREGRDYLVGDGRRIEAAAEVRFRYAWDHAFRMTTATVHDDCS
uniref:Acetylglucosaminyltransferase family protein n=1 Tax=Saccharum hybrid cultivar R570 TaxID=131158 RepID=A0A059Q350_9POAL|nr:Acetylglucosaminyltransferase family protein [Saccharum hybrid cultivar R570]